MRRIGSRAVSWLVAAAVTAMLSPLSMSFAAQNGPNTVNSAAIIAADGTSGQSLTTGTGVKSEHIQNGAVTASKLGQQKKGVKTEKGGQIFNVDKLPFLKR